MSAMLPFAGRLVVRRAVLNRVWLTTYRLYPVFPVNRYDEFRQWLGTTRPLLFAGGVTNWVSSLFATPAAPVQTGTPASGGSGRRRRNPMHLLPSEIKRLLENHRDYVCHRTDNEAAGTCREPVYGVTEQHLKKNPMAPDGVWAVLGVRGFKDYGNYLVIYPRWSGRHTWTVMDLPAVLCQVDHLDPEDATGWCTQEDLDEALRL